MKKILSLAMLILSVMAIYLLTGCAHSHSYKTTIVSAETCTAYGVVNYKCSCGDNFDVENNRLKAHTYAPATCYVPQTCTVCGATKGTAKSHVYNDDNICTICGNAALNLTIVAPSGPITHVVAETGEVVVCRIDMIGKTSEYKSSNDTVTLTIYWSGEKVADPDHPNSITPCYIGYALYDSEGYVVACGYDASQSMRPGDKFKHEAIVIPNLTPEETYTLKFFDYTPMAPLQ